MAFNLRGKLVYAFSEKKIGNILRFLENLKLYNLNGRDWMKSNERATRNLNPESTNQLNRVKLMNFHKSKKCNQSSWYCNLYVFHYVQAESDELEKWDE